MTLKWHRSREQERELKKKNQAISDAIDEYLKTEWKRTYFQPSILVMGLENSGKTTLVKQFRLVSSKDHGYTDEERRQFTQVVYRDILTSLKTLLCRATLANESVKGKAEDIMALPENTPIDNTVGELVKSLWTDTGLQDASFQAQDSLAYFCAEMDRIMADNYISTNQDILHAREKKSGIISCEINIRCTFQFEEASLPLKQWRKTMDLLFSRRERPFHGLLFTLALDGYDQYRGGKASLDTSVELFDEIVGRLNDSLDYMSPILWFKAILVLTKKDFFREKLARRPFRVDDEFEQRYEDYKGPVATPGTPSAQVGTAEFEKVYEATLAYIVEKFKTRTENRTEILFSHFVVDENDLKVKLEMCIDEFLSHGHRDTSNFRLV